MTDDQPDPEVAALLAEITALKAEAFKRSDEFANQCVAVDYLKTMANHFDEPFDAALGAFRTLSENLQYLVHSPQGQTALSICLIHRAGTDHDILRPAVH